MMCTNIDDYDKPEYKNRDKSGRFQPGNKVGVDTRFPPGTSGNPGGSHTTGAWIAEWMNILCPEPSHVLLEIIEKDDEPVAKQIAAQRLLGARREGRDGREETALVCDRTAGRPHVSVQIMPHDDPGSRRAIEAYDQQLRALSPEHLETLALHHQWPNRNDDEEDPNVA